MKFKPQKGPRSASSAPAVASAERPFKIAIGVPCRDVLDTDFARCYGRMLAYSALALVAPGHATIVPYLHKGTILDAQRSEIVNRAGLEGCTHILWLDTDMTFPKETLVRLLSHGKDFVACNYVTRRAPPRPVAYKRIGEGHDFDLLWTEEASTGLESVHAAGLGVALTSINVFAAVGVPFFETHWDRANGGYVGEDVHLCRRARDAGFEVFIDHDLSKDIGHVGMFEYRHEHGLALRDDALTAPASRVLHDAHPPAPSDPKGLIVVEA